MGYLERDAPRRTNCRRRVVRAAASRGRRVRPRLTACRGGGQPVDPTRGPWPTVPVAGAGRARHLRGGRGAHRTEVRRHVGRRHRPHSDHRRSGGANTGCRALGGGRRLGDGGRDQPAAGAGQGGPSATGRSRDRRARVHRRAGDVGADRDRAPGARGPGALVSRSPDPHRHGRRTRQGAHRAHRRRRAAARRWPRA